MKVKFTKLAALLLAGAALFATGCTDYEVDIQKVDKKVDNLTTEVNGKISSLEQQIAGINATIATLETAADHKADIDKLNQTIKDLETALRTALDTKVDKDVYNAKMSEINGKIQDLEAADNLFKDQIATLTTELAKKVDQTDFDKAVADITGAISGEIARAKEAEQKLQEAIDKINNVTIPALQAQVDDIKNVKIPALETEIANLKSGKLDKAEFEAYKSATATTIKLIQDAIQNLADTKLDKTEFNKKVDEILAKFDDYVLVKDFEAFKKIAATKEELESAKSVLQGQIDGLKALIGEFPEGTTVRKYIDDKVAGLQGQIDNIVNKLIPELDSRVAALEKSVNEVILPEINFALGYEGEYSENNGLQGYIEDWAIESYIAACDYTDEYMAFLIDQLNQIFAEIYDLFHTMLSRIQSIVYVPDYDDLKITTNLLYLSQTLAAEPDAAPEKVVTVLDQPFKVTYKITPTYYAPYVANTDMLYFDVKPVNTRDDAAADAEPELEILDVLSVDDYTGEVELLVQGHNIASAQYAANGLKPDYHVGFYPYISVFKYEGGDLSYGDYKGDMNADELEAAIGDIEKNYDAYVEEFGKEAVDAALAQLKAGDGVYTAGVWQYGDLLAYEGRSAFAAALQLYNPDIINSNLEDILYENEISSTYNVLYPNKVADIEILPDPYKPELDEEGKPKTDPDGNTILVKAVPEYQYLPYSSLRENPVGEAADQDPKGYRIILDQAVPGFQVTVDGESKVLTAEDATRAGYVIPAITTSFDEFTYDKNTAVADLDEENFVETAKVYAEIEMNPEKTAAERKLAIGNVITGNYYFETAMGKTPFFGQVEITPALGKVGVTAEIVWTWEFDAAIDHNRFYENEPVGQGEKAYSREAYEVTVNADDMAYLKENLDVDLSSFSHQTPSKYTITYVDEAGKTVDVTDQVVIDGVTIKDGKLLINISNFEWNKVYTVTANYELDDATITVTAVITTIDRNREMVTLPKYEYTFGINEFDEETGFGYIAGEGDAAGYYYWKSDAMHKPIFQVFDEQGVINVRDNVDFEFDADQADFNEGELDTWLRAYNEEPGPGTAWKYVDINRNGIYGETKSANAEISAQSLKDMNSGKQSPDDPYVFLGNVIYRYVTTFIGEVVEIPFQFNYRVPAYDFLHQPNYTFDDGKWYTMASPKYEYNKKALKKYDVEYMNVPALAFNIIDKDKRYFNYKDEVTPEDTEYFYNDSLKINFYYTGPDTVDETPLEEQSATDALTKYADLWFNANDEAKEYSVEEADNFEHTVFYYRSIRDAIPMYGTLEISSDGVRFEIPTSFEVGSKGKYIASKYVEGGVEYSNYELRAWKPFYVPTYQQTLEVKLDEHGKYYVNVLEGLQFFDGRQVAASTPVDEVKDPFVEGTYSLAAFNNGTKSYFRPMLGFNEDAETAEKTWGWIKGNVDPEDQATVDAGNGYAIDAETSWDAYDLQEKSFVFDKTGVPMDLRRLIDINEETYTMVFDYNSQIQFSDTATISFAFDLQSPWQKFEKPFAVNVVIKGLNAQ